ncbi:OmpP1/FadL family transporter [Sulfurospirillum sp. 1612]|uniref:OmpP1/FadL family transporter n=1 Tax=Sulfurospirillum sp. 1612 TaxID=3094835 RepID=UPI002F955894
MKKYVAMASMLGLSAATLFGAGYKIPEQSLNGVALSAAYVANAKGADASYYNPANMAFSPAGAALEMGMTYINLPSIKYEDVTPAYSGDSKVENFLVPTFHYISPEVNKWRFGLSFTAPGGLSKRWDNGYSKATAQEFTLKIMELNPTASYKVNDKFAIGFGVRGVYTDGIVKSDANGVGVNLVRDLNGDSIDFGYNLALSYKPIKEMTLSATYRSKVDLTVEGNAKLTSPIGGHYDGGASVTIPLPATLDLAAAYTFDKTTVELVYERVYWSSYKNLDFNYNGTITDPYLLAKFDASIPKNWKDTNTYRIGITHQYSDKLKLMLGFAIDESPVPSDTLGFELPDSDAKLYSVGFEYQVNKATSFGLAYLYDQKKTRTITPTNSGHVNGTFKDASAHLVTASIKYRF